MIANFIKVGIIAGIIAFCGNVANAFEVQPMRHSVVPANGQNSGLLTVTNTRSKPLPIELVVQKRVFDENGIQTLVDDEENFIVFPFQALIEPGASQAFRFQYIGSPIVEEEMAYTLDVREVPVEIAEDFTGFRFVYSFGAVVYVENPEGESNLSVKSVLREDNSLAMQIRNDGNSFARLTNDRITLSDGEKTINLNGDAFTSRIDEAVIPPNRTKLVTLKLDDLKIAEGDISVKIRETSD